MTGHSLAVRWRQGGSDRRQQLKWVVFAGAMGPTAILSCSALFPHRAAGRFGNVLWAFGVGVIPVAAGISILKYRLYDIDRIISRTLSYGVKTGLLGAVYFGLVTLATRLVPTNDSVIVADSALTVAAEANLLTVVRQSMQLTSAHLWLRRTSGAAP